MLLASDAPPTLAAWNEPLVGKRVVLAEEHVDRHAVAAREARGRGRCERIEEDLLDLVLALATNRGNEGNHDFSRRVGTKMRETRRELLTRLIYHPERAPTGAADKRMQIQVANSHVSRASLLPGASPQAGGCLAARLWESGRRPRG
jgi:hypothetical protein